MEREIKWVIGDGFSHFRLVGDSSEWPGLKMAGTSFGSGELVGDH